MNRSNPAASATAAKSPACALNPTIASRASSIGTGGGFKAVPSSFIPRAASKAGASHRSAPAAYLVSDSAPARAPKTAVGIEGWTSATSHGIARRPQCRPWPTTAPTTGEAGEADGSSSEAPRLTGCHGRVRRWPSAPTATLARRSGASSKIRNVSSVGVAGASGRRRADARAPRGAEVTG